MTPFDIASVIAYLTHIPFVISGVVLIFTTLFFLSHRKEAFLFLSIFISTILMSNLIKWTTEIPRPEESFMAPFLDPNSFSFPSTHTANAFALACFFSWLYFKKEINYRLAGMMVLFFSIAGIIAWSRVALGAHTVFDIIAGSALGILISTTILILLGTKKK